MALSSLGGDEVGVVFGRLGNPLEQWLAVDFGSTSSGLRALTAELQQELKAEHEVAAALCHKVGMRSCKELREAKRIAWFNKGLSAADLATLGKLGSVLPALEKLSLYERSAGGTGPDGVQRLAVELGVGALPSVTTVAFYNVHVGDAGASALATALGRGALPQLASLSLTNAAIGDAGLVALAPTLRQLPALEYLDLSQNPLGDEGLAALLAPPLPAGAMSAPTGGLAKLNGLLLSRTQISDAGCATLACALESGALSARLKSLNLAGIPASTASRTAVHEAMGKHISFSLQAEARARPSLPPTPPPPHVSRAASPPPSLRLPTRPATTTDHRPPPPAPRPPPPVNIPPPPPPSVQVTAQLHLLETLAEVTAQLQLGLSQRLEKPCVRTSARATVFQIKQVSLT